MNIGKRKTLSNCNELSFSLPIKYAAKAFLTNQSFVHNFWQIALNLPNFSPATILHHTVAMDMGLMQ